MHTPKISVIIPVYNTEKLLTKCLDSIVNQTLKNIEIIILNDCSPDNSQQIIDRYASRDNRIISVINKTNLGLGGTRNKGIKLATAEYIAFVDSDDWLDLNAFQLLYNSVTKHQADMAIFRHYLYYESNEELFQTKSLMQRLKISNDVLLLDDCSRLFDITSACLKIYRKSIIKKHSISFPVNLYYEDIPFSFDYYINMSQAVIVDRPLYYYRQHPGTITTERGERMMDLIKIIKITDKKILSKIKDKDILKDYNNKKWDLLLQGFYRLNNNYKRSYFNELIRIEDSCSFGELFISRSILKLGYFSSFSFVTKIQMGLKDLKFRIKRFFFK